MARATTRGPAPTAAGPAVYGPYGGAGVGARYNPRTGTYARGAAAYGPYGARGVAGAYNPRTGAYGATRQGSNVYGSWGSTGVRRGDQWAATSRVTSNVTGATTRATRTSEGGAAVSRRGPQGGGFVGTTGSGDVYAGRDGNVYRKQGDSWQQYGGGGGLEWPAQPVAAAGGDGARAATPSTTRPAEPGCCRAQCRRPAYAGCRVDAQRFVRWRARAAIVRAAAACAAADARRWTAGVVNELPVRHSRVGPAARNLGPYANHRMPARRPPGVSRRARGSPPPAQRRPSAPRRTDPRKWLRCRPWHKILTTANRPISTRRSSTSRPRPSSHRSGDRTPRRRHLRTVQPVRRSNRRGSTPRAAVRCVLPPL